MEDLKNYYNGDISILNDEDLKIYSLYYSLLIDYLLKNSNLKKVDEDILNLFLQSFSKYSNSIL